MISQDIFLVRDQMHDRVVSHKHKPTDISDGTAGDTSCFVNVILVQWEDNLRARDALQCPAGMRVCGVVTWQYSRGNLQPFQHKMLLYLRGLFICPHPFSSSSNLSVNTLVNGVIQVWGLHTGSLRGVWGLSYSRCWPFQSDKCTVINEADKWYIWRIVKFL